MGIRRIYILSVVFCLFLAFEANAQTNQGTHEVVAGETVYGISKKYGVSVEALIKANPDIRGGLKEGSVIAIPGKEQPLQNIAPVDTNFIQHTVLEGETLYSLSKKYNVEIDEIKKHNPSLVEDGLKLGQVLNIPKKAKLELNGTPLPNDFHYHEIQPGETAYSLSKKYKIGLDSLYILNPDAANGLKISQLVKFPLNRKKYSTRLREANATQTEPRDGLVSDETNPVTNATSGQDSSGEKYFLYKVEPGDSFFSLKNKFGIDREKLIELNPELVNGIELDKYIIIPGSPKRNITDESPKDEKVGWLDRLFNKVDSTNTDTVRWVTIESKPDETVNSTVTEIDTVLETLKDSVIEIALLLPFNIPEKDSIVEQIEEYSAPDDQLSYEEQLSARKERKKISSITKTSIEFYQGFLMAMDSLSRKGLKITVRVYDTKSDIQTVLNCMDTIIQNRPDLVVGPLLKNNVEWVADKLKEFNIPVISPLSRNVEVLGHPNLIQCRQGDEELSTKTAEIINKYFETAHLVFAHAGKDKELQNVQLIKSQLGARKEDGFMRDVSFTEEMLKRNELRDVIIEGKKNVFVIASEDKVFLSDLVNKLRQLRDTSIYIIGPYKLMDIQTLEVEYLNMLHLTMPDPSFVDYQDSITKSFISAYRNSYETEPSDFAFQAYDIGLIYVNKLAKSGGGFLKELENDELTQGLYTQFQMIKVENGGFQNQPVYIAGIRDLVLVKLSD